MYVGLTPLLLVMIPDIKHWSFYICRSDTPAVGDDTRYKTLVFLYMYVWPPLLLVMIPDIKHWSFYVCRSDTPAVGDDTRYKTLVFLYM